MEKPRAAGSSVSRLLQDAIESGGKIGGGHVEKECQIRGKGNVGIGDGEIGAERDPVFQVGRGLENVILSGQAIDLELNAAGGWTAEQGQMRWSARIELGLGNDAFGGAGAAPGQLRQG